MKLIFLTKTIEILKIKGNGNPQWYEAYNYLRGEDYRKIDWKIEKNRNFIMFGERLKSIKYRR